MRWCQFNVLTPPWAHCDKCSLSTLLRLWVLTTSVTEPLQVITISIYNMNYYSSNTASLSFVESGIFLYFFTSYVIYLLVDLISTFTQDMTMWYYSYVILPWPWLVWVLLAFLFCYNTSTVLHRTMGLLAS